jgi:hypothetical protein
MVELEANDGLWLKGKTLKGRFLLCLGTYVCPMAKLSSSH